MAETEIPPHLDVNAAPLTTRQARELILERSDTIVVRKRARVRAFQVQTHGRIETDRGWLEYAPGDYLAMNHEDDDPGSDAWPVSRERFEATYGSLGEELPPTALIAQAIYALRDPATGRGRDRHESVAITHLEDALFRLEVADGR